ncbi:hypothetical protein COCNU_scaffold002416G000030 [Cocos nucifera]|nr:hypothetical protein [Cocos nucifera]
MSHTCAQPTPRPLATSGFNHPETKVFLLASKEMAEISSYLDQAAIIESFGRPVKVDDVSSILAKKVKRCGPCTTKQLTPTKFFVAFLDKASIQALMAQGRIRGDGFTLLMNHWNQYKGGEHHNFKLKIYTTLFNLPLFCWNAEAVAIIISGFGVPQCASRSSLQWEDLRGFDIVFFCEDIESVPEVIKIQLNLLGKLPFRVVTFPSLLKAIPLTLVLEVTPKQWPTIEGGSNFKLSATATFLGKGADADMPPDHLTIESTDHRIATVKEQV